MGLLEQVVAVTRVTFKLINIIVGRDEGRCLGKQIILGRDEGHF